MNSYEDFYFFMTLLVSKKAFDQEILEQEETLKFFHKLCESPVQVRNVIAAMAGHNPKELEQVLGPVRMFWSIYKRDGESTLREVLDSLESMKDDAGI